jgi:dTDP-4-amino-4,6-dideoxygalactose transaminase
VLEEKGFIELPIIPRHCSQNAHMFYLKVKDLDERTTLLDKFKKENIWAVFHYVPLHSAPAGLKFGRFEGKDIYTTKESERLIRLPMYYGIGDGEIDRVCDVITTFYGR